MMFVSCSDSCSTLRFRLLQLQSRFTWDLKKDDMDLENLSARLQDHIELQIERQRGSVARSYSFLAYVRYLQDQPEEAESFLSQSEEKTRESYGEDSEQRLIVTYGDLAWLKYHSGHYEESERYCQKVDDILAKFPTGSSTVLRPEVYGEKAWTYFKFSRTYYDKAIDCFCKALELQPDDSELNAGLAIALYRTEAPGPERSQESSEESPATKQLRRALGMNPDDGVLMSMLALKIALYHKTKRLKTSAEELFQQGLKMIKSESEKTICQVVHHRYADFHHYHTKQQAMAIDHYTQGLLITSETWESKYCAKMLRRIAERRLSEDKNDGQAYALLAVVAAAEGDKKKAADFYENALGCDKDNDEYLSALCSLRMELQ
ncbi:hypothetical protein INR49_020683 [Caranx melampygus]|nr:hypothetical protein INR49_020683 [Caranx melampygus]